MFVLFCLSDVTGKEENQKNSTSKNPQAPNQHESKTEQQTQQQQQQIEPQQQQQPQHQNKNQNQQPQQGPVQASRPQTQIEGKKEHKNNRVLGQQQQQQSTKAQASNGHRHRQHGHSHRHHHSSHGHLGSSSNHGKTETIAKRFKFTIRNDKALGRGSFGTVFLAHDLKLPNETKAVKLEKINPKHSPQLFHEYLTYCALHDKKGRLNKVHSSKPFARGMFCGILCRVPES